MTAVERLLELVRSHPVAAVIFVVAVLWAVFGNLPTALLLVFSLVCGAAVLLLALSGSPLFTEHDPYFIVPITGLIVIWAVRSYQRSQTDRIIAALQAIAEHGREKDEAQVSRPAANLPLPRSTAPTWPYWILFLGIVAIIPLAVGLTYYYLSN